MALSWIGPADDDFRLPALDFRPQMDYFCRMSQSMIVDCARHRGML
jgi:hypothetical protein